MGLVYPPIYVPTGMRGLASGFLIPRGSLDGDKVSGDLFGCVQNAITIADLQHTIEFSGQTSGHRTEKTTGLKTESILYASLIMIIFRYAEYSEGDPNSRGYVFLEEFDPLLRR